jgi:hypothetical protein
MSIGFLGFEFLNWGSRTRGPVGTKRPSASGVGLTIDLWGNQAESAHVIFSGRDERLMPV